MLENTLNTISTIAEKYDIANYTTGIYRYPRSKQKTSDAIVQAKPK
jgi:hypothetical protein